MRYFLDIEDKDLPGFCDTLVSVNMSASIFKWEDDMFYKLINELQILAMKRLYKLNPKYHDEILNLRQHTVENAKSILNAELPLNIGSPNELPKS